MELPSLIFVGLFGLLALTTMEVLFTVAFWIPNWSFCFCSWRWVTFFSGINTKSEIIDVISLVGWRKMGLDQFWYSQDTFGSFNKKLMQIRIFSRLFKTNFNLRTSDLYYRRINHAEMLYLGKNAYYELAFEFAFSQFLIMNCTHVSTQTINWVILGLLKDSRNLKTIKSISIWFFEIFTNLP